MERAPRIEILSPACSAEEAAVVVVALQRFMRDTVPGRAGPPPVSSAWARAGLREATGNAADDE